MNSMPPIKFNNLSDLANAHLSHDSNASQKPSQTFTLPQQIQSRTKFVIPKLMGDSGSTAMPSPPNGGSPTPHELSLKKIMDLKRLHISSDETTVDLTTATSNAENFQTDPLLTSTQSTSIDLACALNGPNFVEPIIPVVKPVMEEIEFKFIDCDITDKCNDPPVLQDCNLNMLHILEQHFVKRTKCTTSFGRILCSKYKCKRQPLVQHGFINKHQVKPFNFELKRK